jgi:UDP-glucose 4-epimerase
MKNCLVTGYTGFIGSRIAAALLAKGLAVRGLTRQAEGTQPDTGIELFPGDLTRPPSLRGVASNIDTLFHVAGHAHSYAGNDDLHRQTTLEGTRQLLIEARDCKVQRFIFISSIKAMLEPGEDCLDENTIGSPTDAYGLSRLQAEQLVLDCGQQSGMHVSILRPTLVYGPGCKGNLANMLRWIDRGWFPPLPDTGNRRSMVDVRDVVHAVLQAADRDSANGKVCILSDGEDYSTRRIVTAMRCALGKSEQAWSLPASLMRLLGKCGDGCEVLLGRPAPYNSAMCSRLLGSACYRSVNTATALGFSPGYHIEDALPDMVTAYRNNAPGRNVTG